MANVRGLFKWAAKQPNPRIVSAREDGPIAGAPNAQEDDLDFIARSMVRARYADREYYGPGAARIEAARAEAAKPKAEPGKKKGLFGRKKAKLDELREKLAAAEAELAALRGKR